MRKDETARSIERFHDAALRACQAAMEKQGDNIVLLDLNNCSAPADYFVLITSRSKTHAKALAMALQDTLEEIPLKCRGMEGYPDAPWILLDYYGIVAHIFNHEERDYYNLERLWANADVRRFEGGT